MEIRKVVFGSVLCISFWGISSCVLSEKEQVCTVARQFSEKYFGMKIRDAKEYCVKELHPVIDFREENKFLEGANMIEELEPRVRILECDINADRDMARVCVEVRDFVRVDYLAQQYVWVSCDTFELSLVREFNSGWKIKNHI